MTWSLAVEEQFYLFLPALFTFARGRLVPILVTLGLAAPVFRFLLPNPIAAYRLPFAPADSLFVGVLLALLVRHNPAVAVRLGSSSRLLAGLVASSVAMVIIEPWWRTEPMRSAGMFFSRVDLWRHRASIAGVCSEGVIRRLLTNAGLVWLGQRSYFVYLSHPTVPLTVHALILGRSPRNEGLLSIVVTCAAFIVTLIAAEISWRFIEAPAIRAGHRRVFRHA